MRNDMSGSEEIYGYTGKTLRVDLTTGTISVEPTLNHAREWLGAHGINQWLLYNEIKPWVTPYEPANILAIGAGPLNGTLAPAASRCSIASKNALSNGVGSSNCGGHFAPELKFAGYDQLIILGKAKSPVFLWVDDEHVELRQAEAIWGRTTWETDDSIKKEIGDQDIQVLSIGPAGENLVRGACLIANRNRAAGKCGFGAVMGSKNLKAVAVRGNGAIRVAYPGRFIKAVNNAWAKLNKSPRISQMRKYGTFSGLTAKNERSTTAYKNFQLGYIPPESMKKVEPDVILNDYVSRSMGCMTCPIHCSNYCKIDHGPYAGLATEGVELEDCLNFAGKLAIDYAPAIIKGHALCNQLGLDLDNGLNPISWSLECYQRGIITRKDTDGLELEWGNHRVIFELIRKIAYREGFGNILAEGSKRAAEIIGGDSGYYAMNIKGQDLYEETRLPVGWGLGVCVATRGGGHTTGAPGGPYEPGITIDPELAAQIEKLCGAKTFDPTAYEDKPKLVLYFERLNILMSCLGLCMFVGTWIDPALLSFADLAELYSAATGWETTEEDLVKTADRILNVEKAFNVLHADLGRNDDYPPERFFKEPIAAGPFRGFALLREKYENMLDEYYRLRGWDRDTGRQTRKCLEDLGLSSIADDLDRVNKLIK